MKKQTYIDLLYDSYENYFGHDYSDKAAYIGILCGICKCAYEDKEIDNEDYEAISEAKRKYIDGIIKEKFNGDKL